MGLLRNFKLWRNHRKRKRQMREQKLDTDYAAYEKLRDEGATIEEAWSQADRDGKDWTYLIRMVVEVYGVEIEDAQRLLHELPRVNGLPEV